MISDEEFERAFHATRDVLTNKSTKIFRQVKRGQLVRTQVQTALARFSRSRAKAILKEVDIRWSRNCDLSHNYEKLSFGKILRAALNFSKIFYIYDREIYKAFIGFCKIAKLQQKTPRGGPTTVETSIVDIVPIKPPQPVPVTVNTQTGQQRWDF